MTVATNANFDRLLAEIAHMGAAASASPSEAPLYQQFVTKFPAATLRGISLDEYCVGKGGSGSFCWWLERGLEPVIGRYMPGTSRGHILYFTREGMVYKNRFLRDLSDEEALRYTLKVQATIAEADVSQDLRWLDDDAELFRRAGVEPRVSVGAGRKLRLLSMYHPETVLPIHSSEHVGHFLLALGCAADVIPATKLALSRVRLLQDYFELARQSYPTLSPLGFMRALYSEALGIAPVRVRDEAGDEEVDFEVEPEQVMAANPNLPLNQILYGPPGTGKTYATVDAALEILDPDFLRNYGADRLALKTRFDELHRQGRVRLVTFHQSFSYEDFVEGLRAEAEDGQVQYSVVDGVFKELCQSAGAREVVSAESLVEVHGRRVWKMSLGNTGIDEAGIYEECIAGGYALLGYGGSINFSGCATKAELQARFEANGVTFEDAATDYTLTSVTAFVLKMKLGDLLVVTDGNTKFRAIGEVTGNYEFAQHPDYVDDFSQRRAVRWLRTYRPSLPFAELMNNRFSQMTLYELRPGSIDLEKLQGLLGVSGSTGDPKTPAQGRRVLIIDEINRGNVSRIFGELITLIEPSKRAGEPEMLEATLPYSKDKFSIPNNVYLVGTMNTADRSLAGLDIALRRRFVFRELPPRAELLEGVVVEGVNVAGMLRAMNERIEALLGRDHCLGHAYFIPLQQEPTLDKLAGVFRHQILPLLQEYFFEDWQRIQWVLNDHRKTSEACKFITGVSLDSARLFGPDVNAGGQAIGWRVNHDAFGNIQSYRGILDASAAT